MACDCMMKVGAKQTKRLVVVASAIGKLTSCNDARQSSNKMIQADAVAGAQPKRPSLLLLRLTRLPALLRKMTAENAEKVA